MKMNKIKAFLSNHKRTLAAMMAFILLFSFTVLPVSAAGKGDVAGAVEQTWKEAVKQIKDVCEKVVFPVLSLILAILFFVKLATAYFDCASVTVIE